MTRVGIELLGQLKSKTNDEDQAGNFCHTKIGTEKDQSWSALDQKATIHTHNSPN